MIKHHRGSAILSVVCLQHIHVHCTVKPVLNSHSKRRQKLVLKTDYPLMQVESIAECSKGSILQYFRPSLSYYLSLRSLFCLFLSGRLRQVLLYSKSSNSEPAHEILVLIALLSNVQTCWSLCCWHIQSMDVDEGSDYN